MSKVSPELLDLEWMLLPPLRLGQFRLIRNKGLPMAFVSWAFVDQEGASRLKSAALRLRPSDWNSGDECRIIDLVAPRGGQDQILGLLQSTALSDRQFHLQRRNRDSGEISVATMMGNQMNGKSGASFNEI